MEKPELEPPCSGWQEDLPRPDVHPLAELTFTIGIVNSQDDSFLEISRSPSRMRGFMFFFGVVIMLWTCKMALDTIYYFKYLDVSTILIGIGCIILSIWIVSFTIRVDISQPRDLPIRFNRSRQRIYAYNFKYRWWNPFERWRVIPVAYDWSQVRAERWKKRGATAQGALIIKWGVVLSIVEPGTNKVIDRFPLSTMGADEFAWAYICTYMQQGPSALPPPGPPHDHNDVPWYNLALRLAPKVKWPAEMDRESRTAP